MSLSKDSSRLDVSFNNIEILAILNT